MYNHILFLILLQYEFTHEVCSRVLRFLPNALEWIKILPERYKEYFAYKIVD